MTVTFDDIRAAAALLDGAVLRTPTVPSPACSEATGADVILKLENFQHTGSFKPRGALVKLARLDEAARRAGVVAASAGNHAQGVAYHAQHLGIPATIVMPRATPFTKVARTEALGARVVMAGDDLTGAQARARELADADGLEYVHPYDDPDIIAGQGTVALEMLADHPDLEVLVVPVGGGGLIAGMATAARAVRPDIQVIGVQADLYPSMREAVAGREATCGGETVAEGIAVAIPGTLTRPTVAEHVSEVVTVDEETLERAIHLYLERQHIVVEGAGAASLAALLAAPDRYAGRRVGLVVSGGNMDARLLSSILMRGLVRAGRLARLRVEISDVPGALGKVAGTIGEAGGNIVEVIHQRWFYDIPVKRAEVDVVVETLDPGHVEHLIARLIAAGFPTRRLRETAAGAQA